VPIYEYECTSCGQITERKMSIMADHPHMVRCGDCNEPANRIISGTAGEHIIWKGVFPGREISRQKRNRKRRDGKHRNFS